MSAIDPGMEEPLQDAFQDSSDEEEEDDRMSPSSWWFASTACPLLAGTFGPIASGFNICALVYNWRVYIPPGATESTGAVRINDPHWLVAINAVSLFFAVVGNATLLLNMARRLRFSIAQPITISGFLVGGVVLIGDLAAINSSPTYFITEPRAIPDQAHALTSAYYYAIWAAAIYMIIGFLMCVTVYGANYGYYDKDFKLTASQRTLMLQTMSFMTYLLLGALVFSRVEGWEYLDAVYWADVTLFVVGFGDFSPATNVGRGLLFPFAIGGVLIVGLVIGSIRSLVLERGKEKMSARITEKRRESAVDHVNVRHQTIRVSRFHRAHFSTDPTLSPAQRREEEFEIMRKLQRAAEREQRYFSLFLSSSFALALWFVGAAIFQVCERAQQWTYFDALYFAFTALITLGYGDLTPESTAGRAFFVVWSLLAVPSLTILISNMGDTIIKWFSDFTIWIGSLTVLPNEEGFHKSFGRFAQQSSRTAKNTVSYFTPAGLFGDVPVERGKRNAVKMDTTEHQKHVLSHIYRRLETHIEEEELNEAEAADASGDTLQRDIHFYHYVLASELRRVQKDLNASPPKKYTWLEWEYFLRLMGNGERPSEDGSRSDGLVPTPLQSPEPIGRVDHRDPRNGSTPSSKARQPPDDKPRSDNGWSTDSVIQQGPMQSHKSETIGRKSKFGRSFRLDQWSWLSEKSPLMGSKSEAEWVLERLSAALERELNRQRRGSKRPPPISMHAVLQRKHGNRVADMGNVSASETAVQRNVYEKEEEV